MLKFNFNYSALDEDNSVVKGTIPAGGRKAAIKALEKQNMMVINLKRENTRDWWNLVVFSTVGRLEMIYITRHLHSFMESGIVLDQAIKIAAEKTSNPKMKEIMNDIYHRIIGGQKLHAALSAHKKYFSSYFINLIKVGEESGTLEQTLNHLLEQQEKDYDLLTKTRGAMIYPVIIIFVAIAVVALMLTFVVPTIASTLKEYGAELPLPTRVMISLSDFLVKYGILVLAGIILLIMLLIHAVKRPKGRRYWEKFLFALPIIGKIVKEFNIARFSRSMSAPLLSGLSIDNSLKLAADVCQNTHYKTSIESSIQFVRKGIPMTDVMHGYPKLYPPDVIRMLEIGERTGKFDHMFNRIALFYEKSIYNTFTNLSSVIEPFLLVTVGITVGFIAVSILLPIWNFSETI